MAGGDSEPARRTRAAESGDDQGSAAQLGTRGDPQRVVDPGDRDEPLVREHGDPFEPDLKEERRAARIEGRKIIVHTLSAGRMFETMYRVDRFRRYLSNRGSDGRGLVQFWGPRATRQYKAGEAKPSWIVESERKLNTVNVGAIEFC